MASGQSVAGILQAYPDREEADIYEEHDYSQETNSSEATTKDNLAFHEEKQQRDRALSLFLNSLRRSISALNAYSTSKD